MNDRQFFPETFHKSCNSAGCLLHSVYRGKGRACLAETGPLDSDVEGILTGAPMEAPHFWLVYVIIWLYVLTPFMRYIVHNIPDTVLSGVIGVVFAICALDTYLPLYGINSVFGIVVDSYAGTFLLGYFLSEKCSRKVENFFMFTGFLSFIETCMWIWNGNDYVNYIYQNSPQ